jgi:D-arabinonate dehydratase/D-galactarolactone cycloisomerase
MKPASDLLSIASTVPDARIASVHAEPLSATWERVFGAEPVPDELRHPASHFMCVPRTGQFSTVVTIATDDGTQGIGEAWGLPVPGATASIIRDFLAPMLVGRSLGEHRAFWSMMIDYLARLGHTRGCMLEALSGIDIALWDLRARLAGRPLCECLGAPLHSRIETYASPVLFKATPGESAAAALDFAAQGFRAIKVKAGRGPSTDAAHLAAVRDACGPQIALMVDANGAFDIETALDLANRIAPLGIAWLEEPLPPGRPHEMAVLRRQCAIPLATGENDFCTADFASLLEAGAVDILQPNVSRAGGITGTLEIAALAREHGASVSLHGVGSGIVQYASLHAMAVLAHARWFEFNLFPNPLRDRLATPPLRPVDGFLDVPRAPGLGCGMDSEIIEKFTSA